ncbi:MULTISPECIES: universal stress protein [Cyanophyceae]|uniref:universal stress protein n=1 Tax=Cyanophyceae TaxID=3028117 RepID=UPI00168923C6|nr:MULTISPECIES: universal stress protein [Cyanophyceae]MBD1915409.1 universal stress protein [Phormidium sp. FACHB-77]MBD2032410.1 universal stress protein [Phormidium sp. FACHB-322]MBD2052581.1 universal stress protein [Leptolyngbya sp. FACHB-60]
MFQRALICTDFTDGIYRLAQFVPSLVAGGFKSLVFFHNVSVDSEREIPRNSPELLEKNRQRLQTLLRDIPDGIDVTVEVQMGRASESILRLAKKHQSDVIFLGSPTRTLLEEKLFGSTTAGLAEKTIIPIIILRPQLVSTYTTAELKLRCAHLFRYLLVPYDGTQGGKNLIKKIHQQVKSNPNSVLERVRLLWVIDENMRRELRGDNPMKQAEQELDQLQAELAALNLVVNTTIVEGSPLAEILKAAEMHDIGAIATCSSNLGGILKWSAPSFTREILRSSWHPVLFFPS